MRRADARIALVVVFGLITALFAALAIYEFVEGRLAAALIFTAAAAFDTVVVLKGVREGNRRASQR